MKNYINKLFNERILRGDQSNFSGILEALNFDGNSKAVNKAYEQRVLSVGDFDERIFLGNCYLIIIRELFPCISVIMHNIYIHKYICKMIKKHTNMKN